MKKYILKIISSSLILKFMYNFIKDKRLRAKILKFQSKQPRNFTITSNLKDSYFSVLAEKFGSDKDGIGNLSSTFSWPSHTYGSVYDFLFSRRRLEILRVFECGIGTNNELITSNMGPTGRPGASLRLWADYFPNCEVIGIDIDPNALIDEPRIKCFTVDQTNARSIEELWNRFPDTKFDLMIDDGLHNLEAGMTLLVNSIKMLADDGFYIIEDVSVNYLEDYSRRLAQEGFNFFIISLNRSNEFGYDNNLILIKKNEN